MNRMIYTFTMLGGLTAVSMLSHVQSTDLVTLAAVFAGFAVLAGLVYATVQRARDAGVNPTLWAFLMFLPLGWIILACKPTAKPAFYPPLAITA